MRIGFLSAWDVDDPRAWSGVVRRMYQALSELADVVPIFTGDIRPALVDRVLTRTLGRAGKRYLYGHAVATSIKRGHLLRDRVLRAQPDVLLDVAASQDVAFFGGPMPTVHVSDTTFRAIRDYYPVFSNLHWISAVQGRLISSRTLRQADRCAAASDWAREAMIRDHVDPTRVGVVPFGPALAPQNLHEPRRAPTETLRLLAVASEWERKGGDLAVATYEELRRRGQEVALTVVGETPPLPREVAAPGRVSGREMTQLYLNHDVLVELARANAAGVTLTDAAAFGLPVVATDTGGVPTIVQHEFTGYLVDPGRDVVLQAVEAISLLRTPSTYEAMSARARDASERVLNWDHWAREILQMCEEVVGAH